MVEIGIKWYLFIIINIIILFLLIFIIKNNILNSVLYILRIY